jgi:hypothetical protein
MTDIHPAATLAIAILSIAAVIGNMTVGRIYHLTMPMVLYTVFYCLYVE